MQTKLNELIESIKVWLKTGEINPDILAEEFVFSSPYWKRANRKEFLEKFLDPTEYIEKSLSNIVAYSPMVSCQSDDGRYFTLVFTYETKNGNKVNEAILCEVREGKLFSMKSIYDLQQTKQAHEL